MRMRFSLGASAALAGLMAMGLAANADAAVNEIDIGFNPTFAQTGPSTVTSEGYFFSAREFLNSASDFDSAMLTYPGPASPVALAPQAGAVLGYATGFLPLAAQSTEFPFGTYNFTANNSVTSATQSNSITYNVNAFTTTTPQLSAASYNALQGLKAGSSVSIDFNSFDQNSIASAAYVFLNISNTATGATAFSQGFLDPNTTSVLLPGGVLAAGTNYTFDLVFDERIIGTDGSVGTTIFFDSHTDGTFSTAVPEPATWALMMVGVAGMGLALRRRAAKSALA